MRTFLYNKDAEKVMLSDNCGYKAVKRFCVVLNAETKKQQRSEKQMQ